MDSNLLQTVVILVLFIIVIGLLLYTLKTSGDRERRLLNLLETYAQQLARLADQLESIARDIVDVTKRIERMEYRDYSRDRGSINLTQIGERARAGQVGVGKGVEQEATES